LTEYLERALLVVLLLFTERRQSNWTFENLRITVFTGRWCNSRI